MEISLTEKQASTFQKIAEQKAKLESEFRSLSEKEQDLLMFVVESSGKEIPANARIFLQGNALQIVVPEAEQAKDEIEAPAKPKLKKVK